MCLTVSLSDLCSIVRHNIVTLSIQELDVGDHIEIEVESILVDPGASQIQLADYPQVLQRNSMHVIQSGSILHMYLSR